MGWSIDGFVVSEDRRGRFMSLNGIGVELGINWGFVNGLIMSFGHVINGLRRTIDRFGSFITWLGAMVIACRSNISGFSWTITGF